QGRGPIAWPRHFVEQALATSPLVYVALLATAVAAVRRARRGDDRAALLACFAVVPLGVCFLAPALALAGLAFAQVDEATGFAGLVPRHPFAGWSGLADAARAELPPGRVVVADTYIACAELSFELGGAAEIYVLDHPVNHKHGRALQYRLWGLDEPALDSRAGEQVLLVLDEDSTARRDRAAWQAHVRARFEDLDGLH